MSLPKIVQVEVANRDHADCIAQLAAQVFRFNVFMENILGSGGEAEGNAGKMRSQASYRGGITGKRGMEVLNVLAADGTS